MAFLLKTPTSLAIFPSTIRPSWAPMASTKTVITHKFLAPLSNNTIGISSVESTGTQSKRKLPILLFDIMDTVVRDPFYQDVPSFFGMSLEELIERKHPTAWMEFEKGMIDEMELARKFFKDGRTFDLEGLKNCMRRGYSFVDGVEELLYSLKQNNYEMHAFTNYPIWYKMIDEKLNISAYLSWSFCSCTMGKRKPDRDFYHEVVNHLNVDPASCIFIDDRLKNVEAAIEVGIVGLHFKNAKLLLEDLSQLGIGIPANLHYADCNQSKFAEEKGS